MKWIYMSREKCPQYMRLLSKTMATGVGLLGTTLNNSITLFDNIFY